MIRSMQLTDLPDVLALLHWMDAAPEREVFAPGARDVPELQAECEDSTCLVQAGEDGVSAYCAIAPFRDGLVLEGPLSELGFEVKVTSLYSGLHAIWAHRVSHGMWQHERLKTPARLVSQAARAVTGIEIHPGPVRLGSGGPRRLAVSGPPSPSRGGKVAPRRPDPRQGERYVDQERNAPAPIRSEPADEASAEHWPHGHGDPDDAAE